MANIHDNIAGIDDELDAELNAVHPVQPHAQEHAHAQDNVQDHEYDEYMKKFDAVDAQSNRIDQIIAGFNKQPYDQNKLYAAMDCIKELQKQNNLMYELLVDMNNYLGSR